MAQCPDDKGLVMGNAGILRIAKGCPDQVPAQDQFLRLGALTSKSFDFGMETVTSNACPLSTSDAAADGPLV
ncbi:hypothetical protein, partial [Acinetobacter baumannii]|uniref:hypothetical protein n=1 Tax=Acinetobacter baumannii TaxID=470 RepID=UPI00406CB127